MDVDVEGGPVGEKVEEFESMGEGCTGPRDRRERANSGSEASRLMAVVRVGLGFRDDIVADGLGN